MSEKAGDRNSVINKHLVSVALALAAGAIGYSGHDGWGWCIFAIIMIE